MEQNQSRSVSKAVIHCDVDCFYCQVEVKDAPALANRPLAVHQGNSGGFVAVNYEVWLTITFAQTLASPRKGHEPAGNMSGQACRHELLAFSAAMVVTLTTLLLGLFNALTTRACRKQESSAQALSPSPCGLIATDRYNQN